MNAQPIRFARLAVVLSLLLLGLPASGHALSRARLEAAPAIVRAVPVKPAKTKLGDRDLRNVVVVKFQEGTRVRLDRRTGALRAELEQLRSKDMVRRSRLPMSDLRIRDEVAVVSRLAAEPSRYQLEPLFARSAKKLQKEKDKGEARSNEELADLANYYRISIADADTASTEALIDSLNALGVVEIAYAEPLPEPAAADIAPTTGSFVANQGYLDVAANGGVGATRVHADFDARGQGVRIADVEFNWQIDHEDLNAPLFESTPFYNEENTDHGTSVLGVLVAQQNAYGVTGIAHRARYGVIPVVKRKCFPAPICWWEQDVSGGINTAASKLRAGDVLVIEVHAKGPSSGETCPCNCKQHEFVAVENWPASFDAIKSATARGIIVVEAAGNGAMNLDAARYGGRFNRAVRDSGAILVGAGSSAGRAPMCFTNFGSRIDVQGWGENVATLGRGDLAQPNGASDRRQFYTAIFNGTSSATPIVAGSAAVLQSFRTARGQSRLSPKDMRLIFQRSGMPQAAGTEAKRIGRLPDLQDAIGSFGAGPCQQLDTRFTTRTLTQYVHDDGSRDFCFSSSLVIGTRFTADTCTNPAQGIDARTSLTLFNAATGAVIATSGPGACGSGGRIEVDLGRGSFRLRVASAGRSQGTFALSHRNSPSIVLPADPPILLPQ